MEQQPSCPHGHKGRYSYQTSAKIRNTSCRNNNIRKEVLELIKKFIKHTMVSEIKSIIGKYNTCIYFLMVPVSMGFISP